MRSDKPTGSDGGRNVSSGEICPLSLRHNACQLPTIQHACRIALRERRESGDALSRQPLRLRHGLADSFRELLCQFDALLDPLYQAHPYSASLSTRTEVCHVTTDHKLALQRRRLDNRRCFLYILCIQNKQRYQVRRLDRKKRAAAMSAEAKTGLAPVQENLFCIGARWGRSGDQRRWRRYIAVCTWRRADAGG